ncbi:hypothetical protein [uncultured Microbacterium sp.]|uniref:hypothetical protein n=1 Tax=uncultured Microbacterium sp. TaxID=191216 RepID=UPI00263705C5|nr:hypothetical protein [uncultured Microbacterium sp.]
MLDLLRQIVSFTPVIAALLLVRVINMPRRSRVRQFPMPAVALVYAIAVLIALNALNTSIDDVLRAVFDVIPFLRGLYETTWQYVIENVAVLLVFAVLKLVLLRIFSRLFQGDDFLGSSLVEGVYRYDVDRGAWFVRDHNTMLRVYLRVLFWASVIVTVLLTSLIVMFPTWPGFTAIPFPVIAALVIGEFFYAVDGQTREEYLSDVVGEGDDSRRVTGYARLRDVLTETFPGRAIDDGMNFATSDAGNSGARLDALTHSSDDIDRLVGEYFARMRASGAPLDTNLVDAAADLMRGRSTLIGNPFYGDLTAYLAFPAYYHLLQFRKCLIICGRDAIADDLAAWMENGLEEITGVPGLWQVGRLTRTPESDLDVGVLRFADIHDLDVIAANEDFLADVHYIVIAEPSRLLATGQVGLSVVLSRCGADAPPVYAAFDRNHDGLVDALSHLLKVDLTDVVAAGLPRGRSTEMVWAAEGPPMHGSVLPTVTRYLGMGTEIGAVALKYQVQSVDWVGAEAFPVNDMMWIAGQYYSQISDFADLDVSQHALAESIAPHANPWDVAAIENRFLIVEDEIRNVYETIRLFATRSTDEGFVNLISEDYLLRDYMVANSSIFAADPKAAPSIVPDHARTERNVMMRLVLTLLRFPLSERELARELELIGWMMPPIIAPVEGESDEDDVPAVGALKKLAFVHADIAELDLRREIVSAGRGPDGQEIWCRAYRLEASADLTDLVQALHAAYFFVEDEAEGRDYLGSVLYGLVHQTVMPGQFITYAGKYYQVQSIGTDPRRSGVVLRRAAEHIRDRRVYRPTRTFSLAGRRIAERAGAQVVMGEIALTRVFADIVVEPHGYIEAPSRADLLAGKEVRVSGLPVRTHRNKEYLEIHLPGISSSIRRTLTVLLNELFVTIFPDAHAYVVALTDDPEKSVGPLLDEVHTEHGEDVILVVEDSPIDMGLIVAVERNWRRLFALISDYLEWVTAPADASREEPAEKAPVAFPGETPEQMEQRLHAAAEQDAESRMPAAPPARPSWWRRAWRRVHALFHRRTAPVAASDDAAAIAVESAVEPGAPEQLGGHPVLGAVDVVGGPVVASEPDPAAADAITPPEAPREQ